MKFLQLYEGGHPFSNDDLIFLQTCFAEQFGALSRMYGQHYILSGVTKTSDTIDLGFGPVPALVFSSGWIVLNYELLYFAGQTILAADYTTAKISSTPNTVGDAVMYDDGVSKQVTWDRNAIISASSGPVNLDVIDKRRVGVTAWRSVGTAGQPAFEAGWSELTSPTIPLRFRHMHGCVEFAGGAQRATSIGTTASQIFTLPVECRPAYSYVQSISISDGTDRNNAVLIVNTDGAVYVRADTGSSLTAAIVRLDGIRIPLD